MAIRNAVGKIKLLRVNDVGTGWGADNDFLDAEVIIQLHNIPDRAFGFQLRNDGNRVARQAMFDLLRDAYDSDLSVGIAYHDPESHRRHHELFRVWLSK